MHFGTGPDSMNVSDLDPYILDEHLSEIEICSKVSRSVFFLVSRARTPQFPTFHSRMSVCTVYAVCYVRLLNNINLILIKADKNSVAFRLCTTAI